jgi:hypothetical protein
MQTRHDKIFIYAARRDESGTSHEFFQLQRAGDTSVAAWNTIHGLIDASEQAWQAALRLLKRDAELVPRELYRVEQIFSYYSPTDDTIWHCAQFMALIDGFPTIVHGPEYSEARWVARKHKETLFPFPSQRRALAEICNEILDDGSIREQLRIRLPGPGGGNGKHGK